MMYLIDTNVMIWWATESHKIAANIRNILSDNDQDVFYSVIAPWEASIKYAKGKLPLPASFFSAITRFGFACLPIEEKHVTALRELPKLHGDPFDRMLVAQAKSEKMTLITGDKRLAAYPVKLLLARTK